MTDISQSTDGVALNALGSSGGALVATDIVSINGNAASHVQYMKMGWGSTGDEYYEVGTDNNPTARPLPVMLRHTDGTAIGGANNVLDVKIASQGSLAISADILHTLGALTIEGTAGMHPLEVEGSSGAAPVWIAATGGTFSATNPNYTLPTMLFGASLGGGGYSAAPVGITGNRLMVNHPDALTVISDGSGTFVQSTGGFTLSRLSALNTTPSVLFGVTHGGGIAPLGVTGRGASGHRLLVDLDGETVTVSQTLTGSAGVGGTKTMPSLIYGMTGASAQAVNVTGGRMYVSVLGETLKIDNASNAGLYVRATGGSTVDQTSPLGMLPTVLYGHTAGGGLESIAVSGGLLAVDIRQACITLDVTLATTQKVLNATADAGNIHHRYLMISGVTNNGHKPEESHPVFVSGKDDGSTYSYPIGITTSMVGASGGAWPLHVTADNIKVTAFTPTVTVSATKLDTRGLTAKAAGQDSIIAHGETAMGSWNWMKVTGGFCGATSEVSSFAPTMLFGNTAGGGISPVTVTGGNIAAGGGVTFSSLLVGIGHPVDINSSKASPLYMVVTGGMSAEAGANGWMPVENAMPSLLLGISGPSAAPVGMSADMLKVYLDDGISAGKDSIVAYGGGGLLGVCGSPSYITAYNTLPTLLHGFSASGGGGSAAPIGMSGDAMNVNLVNAGITVDVSVGTHVEVSNDNGPALFIQGATNGHGACAGVIAPVVPVYVAGGTAHDQPVKIEGKDGMTPVEVRGSTAPGYYPVGITSDANWAIASDGSLVGAGSIGNSLDNLYTFIQNGLNNKSGFSAVVPDKHFATDERLVAMQPDGGASKTKIGNEFNQNEHNIHLANISSAYGATATGSMNVNIISFPQPSSFVQGQKRATSTAAVLHDVATGLSSGVKIKGHQNNSDYVYVGVEGVDHEDGYPLGPSEEIFLEIDQIQSVYIYASPNGTACYIGS